jgi:hypothetical protein
MIFCSSRDVAFYLSINVFFLMRHYVSNLTVVARISVSCLVLHDLYLLQVSITLCEADALLVSSFSAAVTTELTEFIPRANLVFSFKLLVNSLNARCLLCITAQSASRNGTLVILLHQEVSTRGNALRQSAKMK